jgi:hypothetical protein
MAALRGLEIVNAKGLACPLCLYDFEDNGVAVVLSCGGRHIVCEECYDGLAAHDAHHIADTYAHNAEEMRRREEGEIYCPVCRGGSAIGQLVRTMNYDVSYTMDDEPDDVPDVIDSGFKTFVIGLMIRILIGFRSIKGIWIWNFVKFFILIFLGSPYLGLFRTLTFIVTYEYTKNYLMDRWLEKGEVKQEGGYDDDVDDDVDWPGLYSGMDNAHAIVIEDDDDDGIVGGGTRADPIVIE